MKYYFKIFDLKLFNQAGFYLMRGNIPIIQANQGRRKNNLLKNYRCSMIVFLPETFMTKRAFGELESQILYILKSGDKKTVKDYKILGGEDNYNTVMTVMSRLAEKKLLGREKIGLQYEYRILSHSNPLSFLDKIKNKFFGLKTSALVCHLIESSDDLTDNDLAEMEKLIQKKKASDK